MRCSGCSRGLMLLAGAAAGCFAVHAQDPTLAQSDIDYTKRYAASHSFTVHVEIRKNGKAMLQFQYESQAGVETLTEPAGRYERNAGGPWKKYNQNGELGAPVEKTAAEHLDYDRSIVDLLFNEPETHEPKQGAFVWKYIERTEEDGVEFFTYERTREHPRSGGKYPRFTFMKRRGDMDGSLLLAKHSSNLIDPSGELLPTTIECSYDDKKDPGDSALDMWVTGDVFERNHVLYFRLDRAVAGNPFKDVVLLGATKPTMKVLFPLFVNAAEKKMKLRLYGRLRQFEGTLPGNTDPQPTAEFISSKVHLPCDPDELPPDQKIVIRPGDSVKGYKFTEEPKGGDAESGKAPDAAKASNPAANR